MNNRRYDLSDLKAAAAGRWPEIHAALGIPREYLNPRKHCPCPYCGGKDRYRYTDYQGTGAFICNQCTPDGGSGFDLLMLVFGYDFATAAKETAALLGFSDGQAGQHHPHTGELLPAKKMQSRLPDALKGAAVHLFQPDAQGRLIVAEGIETAFAARALFGLPAVAALSAYGMASFIWPSETQELFICADNDDKRTGMKAAHSLAVRAIKAGIKARIWQPKTGKIRNTIMKNETIHDNTADTSPETIQAAALAEFEQAELRPHFQCTKNGVFYIAVETDKHGEVHEKPPLKLADPIELIGRGTDETGSHYRIIRWRDAVTRQARIEALPMAEIGVNWQRLQSHGITVMASRRKRELLADYLQTDGSNERYTVTNRAGWCADNTAYILPNGEAITAKKQPAKVIYNGDKSQADSYTESGSLEDWQQGIARYMAGNSRLCLAIGTALAAPLARLLNIEAGGFHLFGDSRDGKSTAAKAALSVWGNPETLMLTWTGTGLGFTNTAAARNDGLLVLDEIGQANAKAVAQTAYSVINGVSKVQGAKDGGNRELSRWRIFMLSTGEKPLNSFLKTAGVEWNAGQAARLPDIPSDAGKGFGIYDTLHGHEKGAALSEAITDHAAQYHGTAGRALIRLLLEGPKAIDEARAIMADFMAMLPDTDGQSRTVALRFAITAAALELAAKHGITGLGAGVGMTGIKQCFDAWHSRTGTGKYEDNQIIKQAIDFMQIYAGSMRFTDWNSEFTNHDHAGYRRRAEQENDDEFWIIPAVFESEISKGFEPNKACNVLHAIQWLKRNEKGNRWKFQRSGKGRFYVLIGIEPPSQDSGNQAEQ